MAGKRHTTELGRMTVAIGLGLAVTTGHGVAAADTTDSAGSGGDTSSNSADTGTDSTSSGTATAGTDPGTDPSAVNAGPVASTGGGGQSATNTAVGATAVEKGTVTSSGGALTSKRTRQTRLKDFLASKIETPTVSADDSNTDTTSATATTTTTTTATDTKPPPPFRFSRRDVPATPVRTLRVVPDIAADIKPAADLVGTFARALRIEQPEQVSTAVRSALTPGAQASPLMATVAVPSPAPVAPTPPRLVAGLLSVLGLGSPLATPGGPVVPVQPPPLDLAWEAIRRVHSFLFNSTPTAQPKVIATDTTTGVITGTIGAKDRDGDPLKYTVVSQPAHGTVTVDAAGTFTYTPDPTYAHAGGGQEIFAVAVSDKGFHLHLFSCGGHQVTVPVSVTVPATNTAPTVAVSKTEDGASTVLTVTTYDKDSDTVVLTHTDPSHGSLALTSHADGSNTYTYTYTPSADYAHALSAEGTTLSPTDGVTFTGVDGHGGTATAAAGFTITPTNAAPTVSITTTTSGADTIVVVTARDTDKDVVYFTPTEPAHGTLTLDTAASTPDGVTAYVYRYTPDPAYAHDLSATDSTLSPTESLSFAWSDRHGATGTAPAAVTISPANAAPDVDVDIVDTGAGATITVTTSDTDGDTVPLDHSTPAHGTLVLSSTTTNADGSTTYVYAYAPSPTYAHDLSAGGNTVPGADAVTFTWTDGHGATGTSPASVTITPVNAPPVVTVNANDTGAGATVTVNTSDTGGDIVRVDHTDPAHGTLVLTTATVGTDGNNTQSSATYVYTPNAAYAHELSAGGSTTPSTDSVTYTWNDGHGGTGTKTVNFTITPTNTAPVVAIARDDTGAGATIAVTTRDFDGDSVPVTVSDPAHGILALSSQTDNADGSKTYVYKYTPDAAYAHSLSAGGSTVAGIDGVVISWTDGHGSSASSPLSLSITPQNSPATVTVVKTDTSTGATLVVTTRDADGDPVPLTTSTPRYGTLTPTGVTTSADGKTETYTYTYTINPLAAHQYGPTTETISFAISDGHGTAMAQAVAVAVPFVNALPTITADPVSVTRSNGAVTGTYVARDDDAADTVAVNATVDETKGTVNLDRSTGTWTFTPTAAARTAAATVGASTATTTATITFTATDGYATTSKQVTVAVLAPDNVVVGTVTGVPNSAGIAVGSDGRTIYVANFAQNRITFIDATTNKVLSTVTATSNPEGLVVSEDGRYVYVMGTGSGASVLRVIDTQTNSVVLTKTVQTGATGPSLLAINPAGDRLYMTSRNGDSVVITDTAGNIVDTVAVGNAPRGIVVSPDGRYVYVANSGADTNTGTPSSTTVSVIDTSTNKVVNTYQAGSGPFRVAISPDGSKLYVTNSGANTVSVLNAQTGASLGTVPVGDQPWGIAVTPDGSRLYVANHTDNTVTVIDTATSAVIATAPVGNGPINVTVSPDGTHVYVSDNTAGTVTVISVVPGSSSTIDV